MEDLNIYYIGGAGGYYFLHQLLITKNYWCAFDERLHRMSFDQIRQYTFDPNRAKWKDNEIEPINDETERNQHCNVSKLYLFNNMHNWDRWTSSQGKKICLYTDERSWLRIIANKGAALYWEQPKTQYRAITRKALANHTYKNYIRNAVDYAGADWCFDWRSIVTVDGLTSVFNKLGLEVTQPNIDFLNFYIDQHPAALLNKVLYTQPSTRPIIRKRS
jgi:hypothetical protein